ncbi:hypothetical protein [Yersinia ruckeri]|uniref:hypothetical protein n=1 Tax=Yersinia ruckeri TaxID=29486 RepID=UPI002238C255|nr:hypothetical protein [Yersinia ruckeri]MCW6598852.1 hypothetical protein [Yersinia ruckeri]
MFYSYNRSAAKNPADLLADLFGLMTGDLDFKAENLSTSCNMVKSTTSGKKIAKLPTKFSDNATRTLAFATQVDPNNAEKTIRKVTATAKGATERWLKLQHPLYPETPLFGMGFDEAALTKGMYMKLATTAVIVAQTLYGSNTAFVKEDGKLLAGDSLDNGKLNVLQHNNIELSLGARISGAALTDNSKGIYTIALPKGSDWYIPVGVGWMVPAADSAVITDAYDITLTVTSDLRANAGKSVVLTLGKNDAGDALQWANTDKSIVIPASSSNIKYNAQSAIAFSSLYQAIGTIPVDGDGDGENDPVEPNYAGQFLITLVRKNKTTSTILTNEIIADVVKEEDVATRPVLNHKPYVYQSVLSTDGKTYTHAEVPTLYTYKNQPSQSLANSLNIFGDLSLDGTNKYIEFVVSNSGILFMNNNVLTQNDQMLNYPIGVFFLESISVAAKGINVTNGVSMTGLGNLSSIIEATSTYNSASGEVQREGVIYQGLINMASVGAYGTTQAVVASEAVGFSHNGVLETSFLETYIYPGNYLYAKFYGMMRPMLTMNHARYELTIDEKEYIGFHIPSIGSYMNALPNPASNLFAYIFK